MTNNYHATPYDISAAGFYFRDYEDYQTKAKSHRNEYGDPVEEYEIQFIEGENYQLFNALGINQANLEQWFDDFEDLDGENLVKAIYLADDLHCDMDEILTKLEDVYLFEGRAKDYAESYLEDSGLLNDIPENLRYYFDVEAFARDMLLSGDITELSFAGTNYIIWGC